MWLVGVDERRAWLQKQQHMRAAVGTRALTPTRKKNVNKQSRFVGLLFVHNQLYTTALINCFPQQLLSYITSNLAKKSQNTAFSNAQHATRRSKPPCPAFYAVFYIPASIWIKTRQFN
jgi:hypothetical protein